MLDKMGNFPIGWSAKIVLNNLAEAVSVREAKEIKNDALGTGGLLAGEVAWVKKIYSDKVKEFKIERRAAAHGVVLDIFGRSSIIRSVSGY